jgi:hypothetical protein
MTNDNEITRSGRGRRQRGQALAEMGMVITILVFLMMGIVEFGRAMMIANMITQAARDGARRSHSRTTGGKCAIVTLDHPDPRPDQIATVIPSAGFTVTATQTCSGDIARSGRSLYSIFGWLFG